MTVSHKNFFKAKSTKVKRISLAVKLLLASLAASSYAASHEGIGFWLLASAGIVDIISEFFAPDEPTNEPTDEQAGS